MYSSGLRGVCVALLLSCLAISQEPTFKAETTVVLVPVVVRDKDGNAVGNLNKDDFQLFDKGKPQAITQFSVEQIGGKVAEDRSVATAAGQAEAAPMVIPEHYVAMVFDDLHVWLGPDDPPAGWMSPGDMIYLHKAGWKYINSLSPGDRVAIYTTSGQLTVDYTADRAKLQQALGKPGTGRPSMPTVAGASADRLETERNSRALLSLLQAVIGRMDHLPGQRTVVLMSPGITMRSDAYYDLTPDTMELINRAIRSRVVVESLDARGLYPAGDYPMQEFMARMSDGTGGRFITDTNDMDGAVRKLAATPQYIYVLGFSPEGLKQDGRFHEMTVKLRNGHGFQLEARKGYYAAGETMVADGAPARTPGAEPPAVSVPETNVIAESIGAAAPAEAEISTTNEPVSFRAQTNLVEVPVVVRDREGRAVGDLRKEDFHVFDKGVKQEIAKFRVEKAAGPGAAATVSEAQAAAAPGSAALPPTTPDHYLAFLFDDLHMQTADLPHVRDAVRRYIRSSLQPGDRAAMFTTSGRGAVDFTTSADALDAALLKIRPSPLTSSALRYCMYVSYFQAVQVEQQVSLHPLADDVSRSPALKSAVFDVGRCLKDPDAFNIAVREINDSFMNGKQETRAVLAALASLVRRMATLPGKRSIILASPGFFVSPELQDKSSELIAQAIRAKVLISSIDSRGVWTSPVYDVTQNGPPPPPDVITFKSMDGGVNDDELIALAEGTGGTANFNNDFDGGVRKAAAEPEYMYVLAFEPKDLKFDGSFHALKVTASSHDKLSLQARRGYWAPKQAQDASGAAEEGDRRRGVLAR